MAHHWSRVALSPDTEHAVRRDLAECRTLLRGGSRTFYAASFLLPRAVRRPASALYAFCRLADDAVDHASDATGVLDALHDRLARVYRHEPLDHACDRAFVHVVQQFAIPQLLPAALLEGLQWDVDGRRYRDLSSLRAYAVRVAGSVGIMMALLMGSRSPRTLARACELGVAMQLSNIARDVGEDARAGRVYLPLDWLAEEGVDANALVAAPRFSAGLARVVERLLEAAERHYARSAAGIADLPPACRPGINAARRLYREIGHEVARARYDSVTRRAVVAPRRKMHVLSIAMTEAARSERLRGALTGAARDDRNAVPEARYLIDAIPRAAPRRRVNAASALWLPGVDARVTWLLDLFERLEHRDRLARRRHDASTPRRALSRGVR